MAETHTNWHVLTGPAGLGRRELGEALSNYGYTVFPDRRVQKMLLSSEESVKRGYTNPYHLSLDTLREQLSFEQTRMRSRYQETLVLNGGLADSIAYLDRESKRRGEMASPDDDQILQAAYNHLLDYRYRTVFLLDKRLKGVTPQEVVSPALQRMLAEEIAVVYRSLGYTVMRLHHAETVDEAAHYIFNQIAMHQRIT